MVTAAATLRPRARLTPGPALRRPRFPVGMTLLSAVIHAAVVVALLAGAALWRASQPKTYVVNLVPAVAAIGSPQGRPAPPTPAPRRVEAPAPRRVEVPEPRSKTPAELPERREPSRTAAPERPSRSADAALPARAAPAALPDRSPSSPPTPLPRPGERESPTVAAPSPPKVAPAPVAPAPARREAAAPAAPPPPPPLGLPAGSAQGVGPVTLNVSDFPYAWYLAAIQRKITERWDGKALQGRQPVAVFEIGRNGQLGRLIIEKTSGNHYYDQIALRAITEAAPFPPLPEGFPGSTLRIHLGFNFAPDRG